MPATRSMTGESDGVRPEANWPPHQVTSTGWSASQGSAAQTAATVASSSARACSIVSPRATPRRPSAVRRSGTVDAQSPAAMVPIDSG